jgi:prepilin-type N-terminal cleavage/methylation domain-containing protein
VNATPRSERGDTLVEVIVSVVILAIVAAGLLAGMTTTTASSTISRNQANAEALLTSVGEAVKDPTQFPYSCSGAGAYNFQTLVNSLGFPGWTASVTNLKLWDSDSSTFTGTSCNGQIQLLTIQVQSPTHQVTWTRDVIKGGDTQPGAGL